jgi:hypothetical protein
MVVGENAWSALIAQGLVQFGVSDIENWLIKLACEKSLEAFCTVDCVSDVEKS